jgi:DNA-directed RNA polymerase specialized sigma24 family protein
VPTPFRPDRLFGGLSIEETAEVMGLSPATVKRHWATARLWLQREMIKAKPA